jgi:hypothetical protein
MKLAVITTAVLLGAVPALAGVKRGWCVGLPEGTAQTVNDACKKYGLQKPVCPIVPSEPIYLQ